MSHRENGAPASIAIAGAWGYIGRKFVDAALDRGMKVFVYDPAPTPAEVDPGRIVSIADERAFYNLDADLFHLAVQPEHRRLDLLLDRREPLWILDEKPMAPPDDPARCDAIVEAVDRSSCVVLYDFPELYDGLTARVLDHLRGFRDLRIDEIRVERSKDREDPAISRNYRRMVSIQYQESVHCLAFALWILGHARGSVEEALNEGVSLGGRAEAYVPPNPEIYAYPVDGRCDFRMTVGGTQVVGCTNFRRGAPWIKRRTIRGIGDGRPFEIEVSYLEGRKSLRIDGENQPCDPSADSYAQVISTFARWASTADLGSLRNGLYPHPRFTRLAYRLSSALWRSCRDDAVVQMRTADEVATYDARRSFSEATPRF
ncbi:Gfo/Idh/MocA family oxidoreductase [Paludisphaera rhizosphaerae]|uniref:hypothetical protein n=1 Tax=Paludisphaera rhizosphaerae TaxID=2711216 RepID=UPI0013EA38CC|nr:hypothetical protein [Paludisphaera rhizosphaerae]